MVNCRFYMGQADGSLHMEAAGHAGVCRKNDPVCAGVSTLVCTLGEAVQRMQEQGMLAAVPTVTLESGKAEISAVPKEEFRQEVLMVFWFAELGMGLLQEGYPENVRIEEGLRV